MNTIFFKTPVYEDVYRRLREMILFGELSPGQAVTIQGFADMLSVGMTPVREAIRRLSAEGALTFLGNRRVQVPQLTLSELEEVAYVRLMVEPKMAALAASHAVQADIDDLTRIDEALNATILRGDTRGYQEHNYRFHKRLSEIADAPILLTMANTLWMRMGPSLRVVRGRNGTSNLPDMHQEAIAALAGHDQDAAASAIERDIAQGIAQIREALLAGL